MLNSEKNGDEYAHIPRHGEIISMDSLAAVSIASDLGDFADGLDDMTASAIGDLREKIGTLLATLQGVQERTLERHGETKDAISLLGAELRNIKHQDRQQETIISNRVELLDLRLKAVETTLGLVAVALEDLKRADVQTHERLAELKSPVDDLVTMRKRIIAYVMALGTIATVVWLLVQPIYEDLLKKGLHALWP